MRQADFDIAQSKYDGMCPCDLKSPPTDLERAEWAKTERRFYESFENIDYLRGFAKDFVGPDLQGRINKILDDLKKATDEIEESMDEIRECYFDS